MLFLWIFVGSPKSSSLIPVSNHDSTKTRIERLVCCGILSLDAGYNNCEGSMKMEVKVIWFNSNKGYGEAVNDKGEYIFVKAESLVDLKTLQPSLHIEVVAEQAIGRRLPSKHSKWIAKTATALTGK